MSGFGSPAERDHWRMLDQQQDVIGDRTRYAALATARCSSSASPYGVSPKLTTAITTVTA
jgi:hypothetical protein